MSEMILRPYKPCDAAAIASWVKDEDTMNKWSSDRFGKFPVTADAINDKYLNYNGDCEEADNFYPLTAVVDGRPVGHLIIRYTGNDTGRLRFGFVIVDDTLRGKGYGKKMLMLALRYAFEILGAYRVSLGVFTNNPAARYAYLAAGFKDIETINDVEINGEKWTIQEMEVLK